MAEREVEKDRPRWVGTRGDAVRRAQANGGEASFFEMACYQSDRLMADGSNGYQQNQVGLFGSAMIEQ